MSLPHSLTDRDRAILDFEGGTWWKFQGTKEQAIRDRFGMNATRYYQLLNALIDRPAAAEHNPALVRQLRTIREQRRRVGTRRLAS